VRTSHLPFLTTESKVEHEAKQDYSAAMRTLLLFSLTLLLALPAQAFASEKTPDWRKPPLYEALELESPLEKPTKLELEAGGATPLGNFIEGCSGYVNMDQPDVDIDYSPSDGLNLTLSVSSQIDTILVVFTPDQQWLCADDRSDEDRNPELVIKNPPEGNYNVWIGTSEPASITTARFMVSEEEAKKSRNKKAGAAAQQP
jgi:hypothetical protein